ncbi:MAG: serine/threonine protein phosphatase [Gammaproteobacteria bacterium]|nr:serine/threonine protein phosphatase [Gammaproteobacteria bacterium]
MAYVFGDIHGNLQALRTLWNQLQPTHHDEIIFLGDYVDRGNDSKGVIDFLIKVKQDYNARFIMGNHEEMMLDCRYGGDYWSNWMKYGGDQTLKSYGISDTQHQELTLIPESHWKFLNQLLPYIENDLYIFTHACLNMSKPLKQQTSDELRWWPNLSDKEHVSGKKVIFGHMSQRSGKPNYYGQNLCIDTSISGWISCFDTQTKIGHQANQAAEYSSRGCFEHIFK